MQVSCINCRKIFKQGDECIEAVRPASILFLPGTNFIIGKSGSGKSTLLHMLAGLEMPTSGQVVWNKTNLYSAKTNICALRKKYTGFIFQSYNLLPELSVRDNILLPLYLNGIDDKKRIATIASYLDINTKLDRPPNSLSGGGTTARCYSKSNNPQTTSYFCRRTDRKFR